MMQASLPSSLSTMTSIIIPQQSLDQSINHNSLSLAQLLVDYWAHQSFCQKFCWGLFCTSVGATIGYLTGHIILAIIITALVVLLSHSLLSSMSSTALPTLDERDAINQAANQALVVAETWLANVSEMVKHYRNQEKDALAKLDNRNDPTKKSDQDIETMIEANKKQQELLDSITRKCEINLMFCKSMTKITASNELWPAPSLT